MIVDSNISHAFTAPVFVSGYWIRTVKIKIALRKLWKAGSPKVANGEVFEEVPRIWDVNC